MDEPRLAKFSLIFGGEGKKHTRLLCNYRDCELLIMPGDNWFHIKDCHPQLKVSGYIYTCGICDANFDCIKKARTHHQKHRPRHVCEHCQVTSYQETKFKQRTERCDYETHLYYKNCLTIFGSEGRLNKNRSKRKKNTDANLNLGYPTASFTLILFNGSSIICCGICEFYMDNNISLCTRHVERCHPNLKAAPLVFTCGNCGDSFYDIEKASIHHQLHNPRTEHHLCNKCFGVFESEDMLREHASNCRESADSNSGSGYDLQLLDDLLDILNEPASMAVSV